MQTRFYTNKENLIKFLKWIKENIKDAVIIDSKLKGDDVIDLIEKDILTCCGVLVFDKDCEIFKTNEKDIKILNIMEWKHSISLDFYLSILMAPVYNIILYIKNFEIYNLIIGIINIIIYIYAFVFCFRMVKGRN